ncbi:DNA polymerase IV [Kordiimonas sediminis]|uniref:DNA-directed DNA polymerase n=1 Tax=Kordiimonas sediminis TaxID=1735581 RepID=A0A919AUR3_9PROT|nr:type VI secretion protein ImpB [Kordiimonas sediminis]GHF24896.1 DNA polymerase IV [Kordiimonas sediminis]
MRKPETITTAFIDFDGFFAGVEEQARPALRGKPIGIIPFEHTSATCVIAANIKAKRMGVKSIMPVTEARRVCPDIQLVPQSPDLYERAHQKLLLTIEKEIPVEAICSIDELSCRLDPADIAAPEALAARIKARIRTEVGPYLTCSIGMAPNRQLAKIASDMDKPDGLTIFHPADLPGRLFDLMLDDIPGVGKRMRTRLNMAGIATVEDLWRSEPKRLRGIWGNVTGERMWYALHGYDVKADPTQRSMFGHGRVLPPEWRDFDHAYDCARLLTIKAARRLRRARLCARKFGLWLKMRDDGWSGESYIGDVNDDHSAVYALTRLWQAARQELPKNSRFIQVHVALYHLSPEGHQQEDLFLSQDKNRGKWHSLSHAMDQLNNRYAKSLVTLGFWTPPPGGYAGGKISFTRIPEAADFW